MKERKTKMKQKPGISANLFRIFRLTMAVFTGVTVAIFIHYSVDAHFIVQLAAGMLAALLILGISGE